MGGGDLNLKKSWHPQTLRNVEKVWKAEQKHEAERKKIEELQRELHEERAREEMQRYAEDVGAVKKKDEKLEWMYQGPGGMVNREEYLMGRPVDKYVFEPMEDKEGGCSSETGLLPGSIFAPTGANSALDMASKIREDPLFMIRKREEEKKREVLNNPVKMKKIKELRKAVWIRRKRRRKRIRKRNTRSIGTTVLVAAMMSRTKLGHEKKWTTLQKHFTPGCQSMACRFEVTVMTRCFRISYNRGVCQKANAYHQRGTLARKLNMRWSRAVAGGQDHLETINSTTAGTRRQKQEGGVFLLKEKATEGNKSQENSQQKNWRRNGKK
nr:PREDICTED: pre-mRNA-splicing factor CWC25 homolog isoform X2 [Anolis carolinensis]|eukprot:XP_008111396.1 PREDICTED: pre-mRNA-splicing factor CWC25 homolog isoform X2 [Anolis carolinensis]